FQNAAKIAAALHLYAFAMLAVRLLFHADDMASFLPAPSAETWTYSAVWAAVGAGVLAVGAARRDAVLRWTGLALPIGAVLKVFLIDMAQLNGMVRVASVVGLAAVLTMVALASRRLRQSGASDGGE